MTELVLAVFEAASAAGAAAQDLEVARIPSAVIRREVSDRDPKRRDNGSASARPSVIVAVDEMHVLAVTWLQAGGAGEVEPPSAVLASRPGTSRQRGSPPAGAPRLRRTFWTRGVA
jgi:hypothetical protein